MEYLVEATGLCLSFTGRGTLLRGAETTRAVDTVSLAIPRGQTLGLVGESGCGKSTLGRIMVGLLPPDAGDVLVMGKPLWNAAAHDNYKAFRQEMTRHIQMVFQDPYSSLNPRMTVLESVQEPLTCAPAPLPKAQRREAALAMLERVGIEPEQAKRFPHQFSGGQRQRIAIARALVSRPAFVVCDEPTSSLDASVQAQILNLLLDLQDELGLTYLFISHDLAVVRHMSDYVAVMQGGKVVEQAPANILFTAPQTEYTRLLLHSIMELGKH